MIRNKSKQVHKLQIKMIRYNENSDLKNAIYYFVIIERIDYMNSYFKTIIISQIQISIIHINLFSQIKQLS